jgi:hypothetical protein
MFPYLFEQNNEDSINESYKGLYYSPIINYQDISERDLNNNIFYDDDSSIFKSFNENKYNNDESRILVLNEKISTDDNTKFKIKLKENIPKLYSFDDIKQKIFKNSLYENKFLFDINNIFIKDEQVEGQYLNKKRDRDYQDDDYIKGFLDNHSNQNYELENNKKLGRRAKNEGEGKHNRMASDNIIKKIKAEIFKYMTLFLNNIINDKNPPKENNKIYKIDYCYINQLNREKDLRYLNMPLKDLFSLLNVSPKYKNISSESNKIYIKNLLNGQTDETIKFAFNMTLRDWLDIFLFKKEVKDLLNEYNAKDNNKIKCKKIKDNLITVDKLLNNLAEKEENQNYFSNFTFYLYNYELWFFKKKGRKSKLKSNNCS